MTDHIRHEPSDVPRRRNMRRTMKRVAGLAVGVPVGVLSVAVIGVLVAANTTPGQRYIERQADSLTGGMVHLEGFGGTFPTALHIRHLEVRDAKGAWLELDRLTLRWSPLSLIHMSVNVQALTADRLAIHRTPVSASQPTEPSAPSKPSSLHLRIDVARVHVGRIEVGKDIAGVPAVFALDGHLGLRDLAPVLNGIQIDHLPRSDVALDLRRLDGPGRLALDFSSPRGAIGIHLVAQDGVGGFISTVGHQPLFDPADLHLDLHGPLSSAKLDFGTQAGSVTASIGGQLDLLKNHGDLVIRAHAPAIAPQPGVAWNSLDVNAALHGDLKAPSGKGTLDLDQLAAAGAGVGHLHATFDGAEGKGAKASLLHLHLTADGLKAPGVPSALLAQAPLVADVTLHPEDASQPVVLTLNHPLAQVSAHADLKPAPHGVMDVVLPDLAPLARIGNVDLRGHDVLHASFALPEKSDGPTTLDLTSALAITGGMKQAVDLVGPDGKLKLAVVMTPQGTGADAVHRVELREFTFDGRAVRLRDEGEVDLGKKTIVRNDATLGLTDFRAVSPSLRGHADIGLHAEGPTDDLSAKLHANTVFGMDRVPQGPLTLDAAFQHLPNAPEGTIIASGTLDRAPLALDSKLSRDGQGAYRIDLRTLSWNSVKGEGRLILPAGARVPLGAMNVQIRNLGDFSALAGQTIGGNMRLDVGTKQPDPARAPTVRLSLVGMLRSAMATIGKLDLGGTVVDPVGQPDVNIRLDVAGLNVKGMTGQASATARGKQEALALTIKAALQNVMAAPASLDTAALLNVPAREVRLDRLMAVAKGETLRLAGPAHVSFGKAMGVDRLRLSVAPQGVAPASIDLAGTVKPALNLRATIANITPALARPFAPTLDAAGTISAQAKLGGTLERPTGNASVTARGLKMRNGPAASLPAASLDATADFAGSSARIAAALNAGSKIGLNVRGTAPTSATGPLALNTTGHIDLSVANAVAGAQGMALGGQVALDVAIGGTASAPRATGRVDLRNASFNHYGQGVRLSEINGSIVASGDSFALQNVQARAGKGTIGLSGTIGAFRPGLPLDIHLTSEKAQPINSDLVTAVIDTDLRVHGQASTRLDVDGKITLPTVTVNIPNSMPASVPQLEVVRPGQKREVNASSLLIGLNISVISPGEFYVRGHGLDAEMKGRLHIGGLSSAPQIDGGFDLRRGFFNLAGINLNFTHGRVAFNGSGVQHKLDPTLDFRADRNVRGTLASLLVTGYASAPKIDFASTPVEPRDQVLAKLLFGTDTASLSTTQLAELAAAVAQLTGASSFDPLGTVRNALGLDRLAVGGGSGVNNGGTSVEAGKNVMKGVYVGAKQATSGSGTQAQVQVDLTKRLKLNTTVGTGGQVNGFTTPENDPGSSVGLSYGFDY